MDVFFKRYFWLIPFFTVGVCAALAGRAGAHLVEQNFLMADAAGSQGARPPAVFTPEKVRAKDADRIAKRNIFCSACAPPEPPETTGTDPPPPDTRITATTLQLELVSTMFVPEDERWSIAVIRDMSTKEKDPYAYNKGKVVAGATVLRVDPKKVWLSNNGHTEYLELEGTNQPPKADAPVVVSQAPAASGDPLDADVQRGVRCTGNQCDVDRPLLDKLLANTTALATSARFVPSVKDGRPNGFKLYAIRPSSIFAKIGLQNGDTIKTINGMEMSSPDQALGVYTKLRSASHLTVQAERRGETVTLDYSIR